MSSIPQPLRHLRFAYPKALRERHAVLSLPTVAPILGGRRTHREHPRRAPTEIDGLRADAHGLQFARLVCSQWWGEHSVRAAYAMRLARRARPTIEAKTLSLQTRLASWRRPSSRAELPQARSCPTPLSAARPREATASPSRAPPRATQATGAARRSCAGSRRSS